MIKLENIRKTYSSERGKVDALKGIDLVIGSNEFVAIMGKSGCGKSTLLNITGCLDDFTDGSYYLDNEDVSLFDIRKKALARSKKFGFVFQSFHLVPDSNVLANVMLPLKYSETASKKEHKNIAMQQLKDIKIEHLCNKLPSELSGGEQQRVAIARALVNSPEVILADEPTGNLDTSTSKTIMDLLLSLHDEFGKTIIMVTHDVKIAGYAERIIEMTDGKIISDISA